MERGRACSSSREAQWEPQVHTKYLSNGVRSGQEGATLSNTDIDVSKIR